MKTLADIIRHALQNGKPCARVQAALTATDEIIARISRKNV